jgi:hypothetical protein
MVRSLRMAATMAAFAGGRGARALVGGADGGVVPDGGQRRHVQDVADAGSAAGDGASAARGAAVAVNGGDADQGGDAAAGGAAEFGQLGDEGAGGDGSMPATEPAPYAPSGNRKTRGEHPWMAPSKRSLGRAPGAWRRFSTAYRALDAGGRSRTEPCSCHQWANTDRV